MAVQREQIIKCWCDRCGKFCERSADLGTASSLPEGWTVLGTHVNHNGVVLRAAKDLCKRCSELLEQWYRNPS